MTCISRLQGKSAIAADVRFVSETATNGVVVSCKAKSFPLYSEGDHTVPVSTEGSVHASEQHICRLVLVICDWRYPATGGNAFKETHWQVQTKVYLCH